MKINIKDIFNNKAYKQVFETCLKTSDDISYNGHTWQIGKAKVENTPDILTKFQSTIAEIKHTLHEVFSKSYRAKVHDTLQKMENAINAYEASVNKTALLAHQAMVKSANYPTELAKLEKEIEKQENAILLNRRQIWDLEEQSTSLQTDTSIGDREALMKRQKELTDFNVKKYVDMRIKDRKKGQAQLALPAIHTKFPFLQEINLWPRDRADETVFKARIQEELNKIETQLKSSSANVEIAKDTAKTLLTEKKMQLKEQEKKLEELQRKLLPLYEEMQQETQGYPVPKFDSPIKVDPLEELEKQITAQDKLLEDAFKAAKDPNKDPEVQRIRDLLKPLVEKKKELIKAEGDKQDRLLKKYANNPQFVEDADKTLSIFLDGDDPKSQIARWYQKLTRLYNIYLNKPGRPDTGDAIVPLCHQGLQALQRQNPEKAKKILKAMEALPESPDLVYMLLQLVVQAGKMNTKDS